LLDGGEFISPPLKTTAAVSFAKKSSCGFRTLIAAVALGTGESVSPVVY